MVLKLTGTIKVIVGYGWVGGQSRESVQKCFYLFVPLWVTEGFSTMAVDP